MSIAPLLFSGLPNPASSGLWNQSNNFAGTTASITGMLFELLHYRSGGSIPEKTHCFVVILKLTDQLS